MQVFSNELAKDAHNLEGEEAVVTMQDIGGFILNYEGVKYITGRNKHIAKKGY